MYSRMQARHRIISMALIATAVVLPGWVIFQTLADDQPGEKPPEMGGPDPLTLFGELLRGTTQSYRLLDLEWDPQDNDGYLPGFGAPLNEMRTLGPGAFANCSQLPTMWLYQMAVEVPLRFDPKSNSRPPDYVLVDVLTYDSAGQIVDSLRNLVFQRADGPNDTRDIRYRSDVRRPLVITNGFEGPKECPDVMTIRFVDGGDIDVVVTDARPQKRLAEVQRVSSHARAEAGLFGDLTGRMTRESAREVSDCLDVLGRLTPKAFEQMAPDIITVMDSARPGHLRSKAMELLCEKGNDRVAELVASYMNECVERYTNRPQYAVDQHEFYRSVGRVQSFVGSNLSLWSSAFRNSGAIRSFLLRLATWPGMGLHTTEIMTAVDTLIELTPTPEARKAMLLEIVRQNGAGFGTAAFRLIPLMDKATLASLRSMASRSERNWSIIEVLAHCGNVESLPMLRQMREKAVAEGHLSLPSMLDDQIQKIEVQDPPQNLLTLIREDFGGQNWHWAVRRALDYKLDKEELRTAILDGATNAESWRIASCREFALKLDVLRPGDLADAGPYHNFAGGCIDGAVLRRKGRVVLPGSVGKRPLWSVTNTDIKAFSDWFASESFENLPDERADALIRHGLCKHHLLPPRFCH